MERLQKATAHAGVTSRHRAEKLIVRGCIKINDQMIKELEIQVNKRDTVEVGDVPIYQEEYGYYLFYKPRGVISVVSDDKGHKVITGCFTDVTGRIYPVGRLDYDASGLLLLTNDGSLSQKLTHPKRGVDKVYVVKIKGVPIKWDLSPLARGIRVDGKRTAPANFQILSAGIKAGSSVVELTIHEGRDHQVKKMFQAIGSPVQKLKRERYGELTLQGLQPGRYRDLTKKEVSQLLNQAK